MLPPSLRMLRLSGSYNQPRTAALFARMSRLQQLYLHDTTRSGDKATRYLDFHVLPRSLRVVQLSECCDVSTRCGSGPSELRRVIVPAGW